MGLLDKTKPLMAQQALDLFLQVSVVNGKRLVSDDEIAVNGEAGSITVDGHEFVYANGGLSMLGYCPVCRMEVPSRRIRSFADIGDLLGKFRVAPHDCMDVD